MQDAPNMVRDINAVKKPGHNLVELAEKYHKEVCNSWDCIIYENKSSLFKVSPEIMVGLNRFAHRDWLPPGNYFQVGLIAHIWAPRIQERIRFRTGLLYTPLNLEGFSKGLLKIPFQAEYFRDVKRVHLRAAIGGNLYNSFFMTTAASVGCGVRIRKSLVVSVNYELEFAPRESLSFFSDLAVFNHSPQVGFSYIF